MYVFVFKVVSETLQARTIDPKKERGERSLLGFLRNSRSCYVAADKVSPPPGFLS